MSVCVCVRTSVYVPCLTHNAPGLSHAVTEGFDLPILSHTFIPTLSLLLSSLSSSLLAFFFFFFFPQTHTHTHLVWPLISSQICLMGAVNGGGGGNKRTEKTERKNEAKHPMHTSTCHIHYRLQIEKSTRTDSSHH